jgi:hypothetical protein
MKFLIHAKCNRTGKVLDTLYVDDSNYLDASKDALVAIGQLECSNLDVKVTADCDTGTVYVIGLDYYNLVDARDYSDNETEFLEHITFVGIVDAK